MMNNYKSFFMTWALIATSNRINDRTHEHTHNTTHIFVTQLKSISTNSMHSVFAQIQIIIRRFSRPFSIVAHKNCLLKWTSRS